MIENNDYLQFLDWKSHWNNSCDSSGCYEEGICRCSKLKEVIIKSVNLSGLSFDFLSRFEENTLSVNRNKRLSEILWDYDYEQVNTYCIERILSINKIWDKSSWFPVTSDGYYGEDIEDIIIQRDIFEKIINQIEFLLNLDTLEQKIFYLLELEYGKVSDNLLGKKLSVQSVDFDKIEFSKKSHLEMVRSKNLDFYKDYKGIKGVVKKFGNFYSVIDGYHRLSVNNLKNVTVIVVE